MKNTFTFSRLRASLLLIGFLVFYLQSKGQIINTVAGIGTAGFGGDGAAATAANLNAPWLVVVDGSGNMYISDGANNRIRKVTASGTISTFAGIGTVGFSGDGGPATAAQFRAQWGIALDNSGNLYIADNGNHRIRKVNPSGIISTIAGNGTGMFSGDGGPASAATLHNPSCLVADNSGNLYIADNYNYRIRKIDPSGIISTIAGNGTAGYTGDGGAATAAEIRDIEGITIDGSGNLYFADPYDMVVRKISTSGGISTFAGTGTGGFSGDGGAGSSANLEQPICVAADGGGNLFIADLGNYRIRKVSPSGIISTVAGTGTAGFAGDGGPATLAQIGYVTGVGTDGGGNLFIVDQDHNRIRKVDLCTVPSAGTVTGVDSVCPSYTTTLTAGTSAGTWVSANTSIATVSPTGVVRGLVSGVVNIYYVVSNSCGSDTAIFPVFVRSVASCATMVGDMQQKTETLQILPNPNKGSFVIHLSTNAGEESTIVITDVLGKKVKEFTASANKETEVKLNVSPGIYFVIANTPDSRLIIKFIVD